MSLGTEEDGCPTNSAWGGGGKFYPESRIFDVWMFSTVFAARNISYCLVCDLQTKRMKWFLKRDFFGGSKTVLQTYC